MKIASLVAVMLCLGSACAADEVTTPYSNRGINDQGVFPAGQLVTEFWDIPAGAVITERMKNSRKGIMHKLPKDAVVGSQKNILWRTLLPNWGHNSPIVMGDRVFLLTEGGWKSDTAELVCVSALDGRLLWQKPVDRMDAWTGQQQVEGKRKRAMEIERWKTFFHYWNRLLWNNKTSTLSKLDKAAYEAVRKEAAAAGWTFPEHGQYKVNRICDVGNGAYRKRYGVSQAPKEMQDNFKNLSKDRIHMREGWTSEGPWYGNVMGSVVGDGKAIYAITALGDAAAYDVDGNRLWVLDLGVPFVRSGPSTCHMQPNHVSWSGPSLALLSAAEDKGKSAGRILVWFSNESQSFHGIDVDAGKQLWTTPTPTPYKSGSYVPNGTPVIMRLNNAAGQQTTVAISSHGMVVRVKDGYLLGMLGNGILDVDPDAHVPLFGSFLSWVAHGDVLMVTHKRKTRSTTGATAAVRLELDGDTLKEEWLWQGQADAMKCHLLFHDGYFYTGKGALIALDPKTGKMVPGRKGGSSVGGNFCGAPATKTQFIGGSGGIRGDALHGTYAISAFAGMKVQGYGLLMTEWPSGEVAERHIATRGASVLRWGSGMTAIPWGNRIFIRNNDYLWCIGNPEETYEAPEKYLK